MKSNIEDSDVFFENLLKIIDLRSSNLLFLAVNQPNF